MEPADPPPPQMADDTAADAKTGEPKKKKRKKKEPETAPKHLKKKKKKKVRRNAAEAGLQPSRRIPSHPAALFAPPPKNAYFLTVCTLCHAFLLSRTGCQDRDQAQRDRVRPRTRKSHTSRHIPPHCRTPTALFAPPKNAYVLTLCHALSRTACQDQSHRDRERV